MIWKEKAVGVGCHFLLHCKNSSILAWRISWRVGAGFKFSWGGQCFNEKVVFEPKKHKEVTDTDRYLAAGTSALR